MKAGNKLAVMMFAFFTFSFFVQQHSSAETADRARGQDISVQVMSFNIHHGEGVDTVLDLKRIADVIRESGAEIVALQEVDNHFSQRSNFEDQAKQLAGLLGYEYVYGANLNRDPLSEGEPRRQYGTATLSKYPIIASENHFLPSFGKEQRGLLEATVNVKGNQVRVYNTHLGLDVPQRTAQANTIVSIMNKKQGQKILAGDLNAKSDSTEVQTILNGAALHDSFADQPNAYTYSASNPYTRIDYLFATSDIKFKNAYVISTLASDHLPIVTEFSLKRNSPFHNGTK